VAADSLRRRETRSVTFRDCHVVDDVLLLRWATLARPPALRPAIDRLLALDVDAVEPEVLDRALREVIVAAMDNLWALRSATPSLIPTP
jgi:hypothetical protein